MSDAKRSAIRELMAKAIDPKTPKATTRTAINLTLRLVLRLPRKGAACSVMGAIVALGIGSAHAQQPSPAQAQAQVQAPAPKPLTPGQQTYDQLDADLHALVNTINARLQAVNDDMTQLRQHVDKQAQPAPTVPETKSEPENTPSPPAPPHKPALPEPGTAKP